MFGPASSSAVSTANNLLAQLWLLPRFSALLPSTHTDPHYHLLCPSGSRAGHSLWSEGVSGCPGRVSELRQGHVSAAQGVHPFLLPSHTARLFFFFSQLQNLSLMGINFIFHLVTALILGLNHSKFRQALEKTLFLSPLISPATPCQPYR